MAGNKREEVEEIRFSIENLLSADNLMDNDSVTVLQDKLNKYVYGRDRLKTDGMLGPETLKAISTYKNESRYWGGSKNVSINPLKEYERYKRHTAIKGRGGYLSKEDKEYFREVGK